MRGVHCPILSKIITLVGGLRGRTYEPTPDGVGCAYTRIMELGLDDALNELVK